MSAPMILYGLSVSSASYRVRIALALKGLKVTTISKQLRDGEHRQEDFLKINPQGFVPTLALDDGTVLTQSMAIIEYLEETYPEPALLPQQSLARAHVRAMSQVIACDIHPLNNLRVLRYLETDLNHDKPTRDAWYRHWVHSGFIALEGFLNSHTGAGDFCFGDAPTLADVCLVPQVFNARRFAVDLTPFPGIVRIDAHCRKMAAFAGAAPELQARG